MKKIVFLFHIYQPSWQDKSVVNDFYENNYLPLIHFFEENPEFKLTLNVAGSLTELLAKEKKFELFDRIRNLVRLGQLELVGSAMYHPLLPLVPEKEVIRQIELNEKINSKYFQEEWTMNQASGRGFYIPELAYSNEIAKVIKDKGYSWIPVDKSALGFHSKVDWQDKYIEENSGLQLFIRNTLIHNEETRINPIKETINLVFIEDGENEVSKVDKNNLWWNERLKDILGTNTDLNYYTVGSYLQSLGQVHKVKLGPSNWEITEEEYNKHSYYHIWDDKNNKLHQALWDFINKIIQLVYKKTEDKNYTYAREELDKAISSCTWWWVDGRFNGYNPTAVQNGLNIMINVIRTINDLSLKERLDFEKQYANILYAIWERHWKNYKV